MLFTKEEISVLLIAIEDYNYEERDELPAEWQKKLSKACLGKLENLNPLTYFTKQEFTFLYLVTRFAKEFRTPLYFHDRSLIDKLIKRIADLATPIGG